MNKCTFPDGMIIKPNGIDELEACFYEEIERYANVTVSIRRCKNCGNIDISWFRQDDTEKLDID